MLALKLEMRASNKKWFKTKDKSEKNEIWMKEGLEGKKAFFYFDVEILAPKNASKKIPLRPNSQVTPKMFDLGSFYTWEIFDLSDIL